MNYAVLSEGVVVNVIVGRPAEGERYAPIPDGMSVAIGDRYANSAFYAQDGTVRKTEMQLVREDVAAMRAQIDSYEAAYAEGVNEA